MNKAFLILPALAAILLVVSLLADPERPPRERPATSPNVRGAEETPVSKQGNDGVTPSADTPATTNKSRDSKRKVDVSFMPPPIYPLGPASDKPKEPPDPEIEAWYEELLNAIRENAEKHLTPMPYEWRTSEDDAEKKEEIAELAQLQGRDPTPAPSIRNSRDEWADLVEHTDSIDKAYERLRTPSYMRKTKEDIDRQGGIAEYIRKNNERNLRQFALMKGLHLYADRRLKERWDIDEETLRDNKALRKIRREIQEHIEIKVAREINSIVVGLHKIEDDETALAKICEDLDWYIDANFRAGERSNDETPAK